MSKQKALDCTDCKYWRTDGTVESCANGHKPRYYQRYNTYKRACDDFIKSKPAGFIKWLASILGVNK